MHRFTASMAVLLLLAAPAAAAVVKEMNLEQLCAHAATIFAGICVSAESDDAVAVSYTFKVYHCFKGAPSDTVTVRMHKTAAALARAPVYRPGQEVFLFLLPESPQGFTSPVGFGQGSFHITRDPDGKRMVANERDNLRLLSGMDIRRFRAGASSRAVAAAATSSGRGPLAYEDFAALVTVLTAGEK